MKIFFKGCLFTFLGLFLLIGLRITYFFYKADKPNERLYLETPLNHQRTLEKLAFEGLDISSNVRNLYETDILFQSLSEENGLDYTITYRVIFKIESTISLEKKLPFSGKDLKSIKRSLAPFFMNNNLIRLETEYDETFKRASGSTSKIYQPIQVSDFSLDLTKGQYQYEYISTDKVGMAEEIIIYDEQTSIVYYQRTKYDAFQ
tara:strand:+ start:111 stop:722 length:612 start_codon:yes stop_codon:yes gene_type:complete